MNHCTSLYSIFQDVIAERDIWALDNLTNPAFLHSLKEEDKRKLAYLFLSRAFHLLTLDDEKEIEKNEKLFIDSIVYAEQLLPVNCGVYCLTAKLFFRFGMLRQKGRFFLLALDKISQANDLEPTFFEKSFECWHLWGNILSTISTLVRDSTFLETALQKYERAAQNLAQISSNRISVNLSDSFKEEISSKCRPNSSAKDFDSLIEESIDSVFGEELNSVQILYWDWAEAWKQLGKQSGEVSDFNKAVNKFIEASQFEPASSFFYLDFGETFVELAMLTGKTEYLEKAIELFQSVISKESNHSAPKEGYAHAWKLYATATAKLYFLTHDDEHFRDADQVFKEALVSVPNLGELWLEWGDLFLHAGKKRQNLKEIEIALEKLTSIKAQECDPIHLSALLGEGILLLGFYMEDFKFLKEGRDRIISTLEIAPENGRLLHAAGIAYLCYGLYFSNAEDFSKALGFFEKKIELGLSDAEDWYGIFESYLGWGIVNRETGLILKGIEAIEHSSSLRPESPFYLDEWGFAYLRLRQIDKRSFFPLEKAAAKFKEAIQIKPDPEILYHYGCAMDLMGDMTGSEEDYENAIDALSLAAESFPDVDYIRYHLALAVSHYGELTSNVESLNLAEEIFESIIDNESEDDRIWCELGYAQLNISVLTSDPVYPEKEKELRRRAEFNLIKAAELGNAEANYHLACLYSLEKLYHSSIHYLKRAETFDTLPPIDDLEHDEWLDGVRKTEAFLEFLNARKENG